jgi:predicted thioesterase
MGSIIDTHTEELEVTDKDTARMAGSGSLEVLATPVMIALMEKSAHILARKHIALNEDTVGTKIEVYHRKATVVGDTIKATANLLEKDGKKMRFEVIANDGNGEIGKGLHTRYVIDPVKFMESIG